MFNKSFFKEKMKAKTPRYHIACGDSSYARLECGYCEKRFKSASHLTYHVRSTHTKERPYQCPDCTKSFHQLVKLKRHRLQHTGERPFSCDVCGKSFTTRYHMKEHRVIHWADQHYQCQLCDRKFSDKNNLRRHQKSLHGPASLKCADCHLTYQSKYQYDTHLLATHHHHAQGAAGSLSCPACGKRFKTKKDLDRHQLTHSKVKPFACLQCDKGFSRKDHLKRHMMKVHGFGDIFEVILEKENDEEDVDDPMELREVTTEKENLLVTVPVPSSGVSELTDKRMPKMVGSINQLPEDIYNNVGSAVSLLQDIPEPRLLEALRRVEPRHFQTLHSILASGPSSRVTRVTREAVRALLSGANSLGQNPVKKSLLKRYRNQSGMEEEEQQSFPHINVSEEQRLAASRALTRWLQENRE